MKLPFIKMHGAGNDYVFVDGFQTKLPHDGSKLARRVSDRHTGIGADGVVFMVPPIDNHADVRMRMWNADGSEGAMCGNALRCIALWMQRQSSPQTTLRIATASGVVRVEVLEVNEDKTIAEICVDLPAPVFTSSDVQTLTLGDSDLAAIGGGSWPELASATSQADGSLTVQFTELLVGNPHAVIFVDKLTHRCVRQLGSIVSTHSRFPGGTNVEWVRVRSARELEVRVRERGSGETRACGSGACAAVAAAVSRGTCRQNEFIAVELPGGTLRVCWYSPTGEGRESLQLVGPAEVSFDGVWRQ